MRDDFNARSTLETNSGSVAMYRLDVLQKAGLGDVSSLPISIRILLESALRNMDGFAVTEEHVRALAAWGTTQIAGEIPFLPARVILQDFTGVPAIVDLAALREAMAKAGADPSRVNPLIPCDLVIDHSVQVDAFASLLALPFNARRDFERNRERYEFLHWGQQAFDDFRVVPPASGIVHQVNLEYLATVVATRVDGSGTVAFPDSLVGTDSHTTMINGLGVLGWGVGGIEAEAAMLGQPLYMLAPPVVGFELEGRLTEGATATDLVLTVTEIIRKHGVVGKIVEYFGSGVPALSLADRATIANMAPEYGATAGLFPVDDETLRYLRGTGRDPGLVDLVERYTKEQGLFGSSRATPLRYTESIRLDLGTVEPSLAGPRRPQDRVPLRSAKTAFQSAMAGEFARAGSSPGGLPDAASVAPVIRTAHVSAGGSSYSVGDGSVVIAAITSCTNTSNPSVMVAAGLLAKKAVERGLDRQSFVKTSMAPGSRVVTRYLEAAGLMPYLQALGFHVVGYGCTTCIGNSGPLSDDISAAVKDNDLVVAAVLSGNRNFEGRINPLVRASYLASPPLVVAYALAGTIDVDLTTEPLGMDPNAQPVFLSDIWPSSEEVSATLARCLSPEMYRAEYKHIFEGDETWNSIESGGGRLYGWQPDSTYVRLPPFFEGLTQTEPGLAPISSARCLVMLGDSITTDHISPAGSIAKASPAGDYLVNAGVEPAEFNSYGSRRGNHEVMMRGTFANVRLKNAVAPGTEGPWTTHFPSGESMWIFDAAQRYARTGTPLIVLAGAEYGSGSSRDWAAKGPSLLGVRAVIARSYERIHRSNLIGMGILPLQFKSGQDAASLGLAGDEEYDIDLGSGLTPSMDVGVVVKGPDGATRRFETLARVDSPIEVHYLANGGILHAVLRDLIRRDASSG